MANMRVRDLIKELQRPDVDPRAFVIFHAEDEPDKFHTVDHVRPGICRVFKGVDAWRAGAIAADGCLDSHDNLPGTRPAPSFHLWEAP